MANLLISEIILHLFNTYMESLPPGIVELDWGILFL